MITVTACKSRGNGTKRIMIENEEGHCISVPLYDIHKLGIHIPQSVIDEGGIVEDISLDDKVILDYEDNTVKKYEKNRLYRLLKDKDYTESALRTKLGERKVSDRLTDIIIEELKQERFIDDLRYARSYINFRKDSHSKKVIEFKLLEKGVKDQIIKAAFEEVYEDDDNQTPVEYTVVRKYLNDKNINADDLDYDEKGRLIAKLMRKGFSYSVIMDAINERYGR